MVPWLRICGEAAASAPVGEDAEFLADERVAHHFGERGHGADFDAAVQLAGRRAVP